MSPGETAAALKRLEDQLGTLRTEVQDLRRFQSWIMGVAAGLGAIFAFMADGIRRKLGL